MKSRGYVKRTTDHLKRQILAVTKNDSTLVFFSLNYKTYCLFVDDNNKKKQKNVEYMLFFGGPLFF